MFEFLSQLGGSINQFGNDMSGLLGQIGQQGQQMPQMQPPIPAPDMVQMPMVDYRGPAPVTDASIAQQEALLQAQDDQLQLGSGQMAPAGLLGQGFGDRLSQGIGQLQQSQKNDPKAPTATVSRGQFAPMQVAQSPLMATQQNPYQQMLARMISGRFG